MAAGSFIFENKIRAGAYIKMRGVPSASNLMSERGTVVIIGSFGSGELVTELSASEILSGDSKLKGFSSEDFASLTGPLKYAYPYVNKIIVGRANFSSSSKAKGDVGTGANKLTATARYGGTAGNGITIIVAAADAKFLVKTSLNGVVIDTQKVSTIGELADNNHVSFTGDIAGIPTVGSKDLTTGTTGEIDINDVVDIFSVIRDLHWNTMAFCPYSGGDEANQNEYIASQYSEQAMAFIKDIRENSGKWRQAVVFCKSDSTEFSDYEGVIVVNQVFMVQDPADSTKLIKLTPAESVSFVAALTAGSEVGVSNTYKSLPSNVVKVSPAINEDEDVVDAINQGHLIFTTRSDGKLVIEQDINSLHNFTQDRTYPFSKNRCIRALDELSNTKVLVWETLYCGKIDNDETGRDLFKSEIIRILNDIKSVGGINQFSSDDVTVEAGNRINEVRSYERITPVDSMEILYSYVTVVG